MSTAYRTDPLELSRAQGDLLVLAHIYTSTAALALGALFGLLQAFSRANFIVIPQWFDHRATAFNRPGQVGDALIAVAEAEPEFKARQGLQPEHVNDWKFVSHRDPVPECALTPLAPEYVANCLPTPAVAPAPTRAQVGPLSAASSPELTFSSVIRTIARAPP